MTDAITVGDGRIRPASALDAPGLAAVYAEHVLGGLGTFEEVPPSPEEMDRRRRDVAALSLPYLVFESRGRVQGFAYAAPFRTRSAYRFIAEDSIYVAKSAQGQGVGRGLLSAVVDACESLGLRQLVAVIGDAGNQGSIALHRSLGFKPSGVIAGVGYKHERWVDVVFMQKPLNGGADAPPSGSGLPF